MTIFDDIGGHFDTFFNRTIPGVAKDIGNVASTVYNDLTGTAREVIKVPGDIVKSIPQITNPIVQGVEKVSTSVVQSIGSTVQQTVTQTAQSFFTSPMVIVGGGLLLLYLTRSPAGLRF